MMTDDLISELNSTTKELLEVLSSFTEEQFNTVPYAGSWTAGQVAEHLYKSESGVPKVLLGATRPTERQPDEKVEIIKSVFLNFNTRLQAPDFIIPSNETKEKETLIHDLKNASEEVTKLAGTLDLSETCTSFPFPQLGELTRLEWICFVICHSRRHILQLRKIHDILTGNLQQTVV
jgi:hypothetical protein